MFLYKVEKTDEVHVLGNYIFLIHKNLLYIQNVFVTSVFDKPLK